MDFKNVQRRVYDALNVLSAMEIIIKYKNQIKYNPENEFIDDTVLPNTLPPAPPVQILAESDEVPCQKIDLLKQQQQDLQIKLSALESELTPLQE